MIPSDVLDRLQAWVDGEGSEPSGHDFDQIATLIAFYRTWARYERAFDTFRDQIASDMLEGGHLAPRTSAEIDPTPCNACGLVKCVDPSVCEEPLRPKRKPWEGIPMPDGDHDPARSPDSLVRARVEPFHYLHPTSRDRSACGVAMPTYAAAGAPRCPACAEALAAWHARPANGIVDPKPVVHMLTGELGLGRDLCRKAGGPTVDVSRNPADVTCADCLAELYGTVHPSPGSWPRMQAAVDEGKIVLPGNEALKAELDALCSCGSVYCRTCGPKANREGTPGDPAAGPEILVPIGRTPVGVAGDGSIVFADEVEDDDGEAAP